MGRIARGDGALLLAAIVAGAIAIASLGTLWPLADRDLNQVQTLEPEARAFLVERGFDLDGYRGSALLSVEPEVLSYVEKAFGREQTQAWIRHGYPLFRTEVTFKKEGDATVYWVTLDPDAGRDKELPKHGVIGWEVALQDDEAGSRIQVEEARNLVREALPEAAAWREISSGSKELTDRTDHLFVFEHVLSEEPELRFQLAVTVAGDRVVSARPALLVPPAATRAATTERAPGEALFMVGALLLAGFIVGAFFIFLRQLRDRNVLLGRTAFWPAVVLIGLLGTTLTRTGVLFVSWEPLWPEWISALRFVFNEMLRQVWILLMLLCVIGAGDALDRASGAHRAASLWALSRGRVLDPGVAAASARGFAVGLICGGVLTVAVLLLQATVGATTSIQPRGFFFYSINSASPTTTTLLFFLAVALGEELGYRFFGASWLMALTRRRWIAIALPALIYGLTHTQLDFLPPAEPFWARPLVLTLVGAVWGWAFLRYDALTVVLSHWAADLFIFNWPRLGGGETGPAVAAVLTICVPLVPALLWGVTRILPGRRTC